MIVKTVDNNNTKSVILNKMYDC
jgi:hypothetical protein